MWESRQWGSMNLPSRLLCSDGIFHPGMPHHRMSCFVTCPGSEWDRIAEKLFICPDPTDRWRLMANETRYFNLRNTGSEREELHLVDLICYWYGVERESPWAGEGPRVEKQTDDVRLDFVQLALALRFMLLKIYFRFIRIFVMEKQANYSEI